MSTEGALRTLVLFERLPFECERNGDGNWVKTNRLIAAELVGLWMGWGESDLPGTIPVRVDEDAFAKHGEFCTSLRRLMHLVPDVGCCDEALWEAYWGVNKAFGKQALTALKDASCDVVWIYNYQLMLAAVPIRQAIVEDVLKCKLGFFFQVPFPPWDVFKLCPRSSDLLQGVLANDFIGFNTMSYCQNFLHSCQHGLGCRVDHEQLLIEHGGRTVGLKPLTIGINHFAFENFKTQPKKLIITSTRYLTQKLAALAVLLPEDITMLLVAKHDFPEQTQARIDEFNASFGCGKLVQCTYGLKTRSEFVKLLQSADLCLVTPLNNGFSLIAKEYVACRSSGVLILSSASGNSEIMPEAITANANSPSELSQALRRALTMSSSEMAARMNSLRRREQCNNNHAWTSSFLQAVITERAVPEITPAYFDFLNGWIRPGNDVVLLLDYDGTLAPIMPHPDLSVLPKETKTVLQRLSSTVGCYIAVISGRGIDNVMDMVGIDGLTYAGNHGLEIFFPDGSKFAYGVPEGVCRGIEDLARVLQDTLCHDGGWIENKKTSLTFHYRNGTSAFRKSVEYKARALIEQAGFKSEHAHLAVEAKPFVEWNKGLAALYILEKVYGKDWAEKVSVIYAGDDVTDEDAMLILKGMATTFKVTSLTMAKTAAERRLSTPTAVLAMLKSIEQYLSRR